MVSRFLFKANLQAQVDQLSSFWMIISIVLTRPGLFLTKHRGWTLSLLPPTS